MNNVKKRNQLSYTPHQELLTPDYCRMLKKKIEQDWNQRIKKKNLIYLGSRDRLNGHILWRKVLKSYHNNEKSFIFSQSQKNEKPFTRYSITFEYIDRPKFGEDFKIGNDFVQLNSRLGYDYHWDQYKGLKSDHFFGETNPKIEECEIYENFLCEKAQTNDLQIQQKKHNIHSCCKMFFEKNLMVVVIFNR